MREVVITGYLRTAQSRSRPRDPGRDVFCKMRADELLAKLLPPLIEKAGVEAKEIDDFIVGCATAVNEQWAYGGRFPIFLANLPETMPAKFVDQQCGSSMAAIHMGFLEVATGNADVVMVGGMEHMTRIPMGGVTSDAGWIAPNLSLFAAPEYMHWDMMTTMNMGLTAQKLLEQTDFTREDMDKWALRSHQLASKAQEEGFFKGEILPIEAPQADGSVLTVDTDQAVRKDTTLEGLASLKPAYKPDHLITAGNSSPLNAAASSMMLMAKETAEAKGIKPMATIKSIGFAGVDPTIMGAGPRARQQEGPQGGRSSGFGHRFLGDQRSLLHSSAQLHEGAGYRPGKGQCDGRRRSYRSCPRSDRGKAGWDACKNTGDKGRALRSGKRLRGRRPGSGHDHRTHVERLPRTMTDLLSEDCGGLFVRRKTLPPAINFTFVAHWRR